MGLFSLIGDLSQSYQRLPPQLRALLWPLVACGTFIAVRKIIVIIATLWQVVGNARAQQRWILEEIELNAGIARAQQRRILEEIELNAEIARVRRKQILEMVELVADKATSVQEQNKEIEAPDPGKKPAGRVDQSGADQGEKTS